MPQKLSNHLKAVIYPENLLENDVRILREHCAMITQFSYQCSRSRNDAGYPYGKTLPSTIDFTVRLGVPEDGKLYYEQMHQNQPATFTFIFNATFGTDHHIAIQIILPVGISFFTFQNISYIVDVYRRRIAHVSNVLDFGFYTSFFPQLVLDTEWPYKETCT